MNDIPPLALPLPADLTHHETLIVMWIGSDPPLLEQMRLIAIGNEFEYDDWSLAATVCDMLYDPNYKNGKVPDLLHVMRNSGDLNKVGAIRSQVSERALFDIDADGWARIRTALLAGTEN